MTSPRPTSIPMYLQVGADPMLAFLHQPRTPYQDKAVLICPPFGWEEICSYRSRRDWAASLAQAGFPAMRIDLPGTGDSGGSPRDDDRLGAWTLAVRTATERLRQITGSKTIAAIGIGLGALLLCKSICDGAEIEEIVLWGGTTRGRSLIREMRAFGRLEDDQVEPPQGDERQLDELTAGGFVLTAETVRGLEDLDLTDAAPPPRGVRRALLLERDGIAIDPRLQACCASWGAETARSDGRGYGAMIAKPHHARAPSVVFAQVTEWLNTLPGESQVSDDACQSSRRQETAARAEIELAGTRIEERPLTVTQPFGALFGTLTAASQSSSRDGLCAVLLNAGAIRRVGPNRMWVEAARRWAAKGVPTLRLDVEGIGDADGDGERFGDLAELYTEDLVAQVRAALDTLEAEGHGRRFVVGGLCSGAYWSFQAALQDDRVVAALLLNPRALFWRPSLETERELRRGVMRTSSWRKVISGEVPAARLAQAAAKAPAAPIELTRRAFERRSIRRSGVDQLSDAFDRLRDAGKSVLFLFSGDEPLWEEMKRDGYLAKAERWPNMRFEGLPGDSHTLRPASAQRHAHELLDHALERLMTLPVVD